MRRTDNSRAYGLGHLTGVSETMLVGDPLRARGETQMVAQCVIVQHWDSKKLHRLYGKLEASQRGNRGEKYIAAYMELMWDNCGTPHRKRDTCTTHAEITGIASKRKGNSRRLLGEGRIKLTGSKRRKARDCE